MASRYPFSVHPCTGMGLIWSLAYVRSRQLKQQVSCPLLTLGNWCTLLCSWSSLIHAVVYPPFLPYGWNSSISSLSASTKRCIRHSNGLQHLQQYQMLEAGALQQKVKADSSLSLWAPLLWLFPLTAIFISQMPSLVFKFSTRHRSSRLWPAPQEEEDQILMLNPILNKL